MYFSVDESTVLTTDEDDDNMPRISGSVVHHGIPKTCQYNSALQACMHEDLSELRVWVSHDQVPSDWLKYVIPVKSFEYLHRLGSILLDDNSIDDYIHHNLADIEDSVMIETIKYMIKKGCNFSSNTFYILASNYEATFENMLRFLLSQIQVDTPNLDSVLEYCIDNNQFKFVQIVMSTLHLQFTQGILQHVNDNWYKIPIGDTDNELSCWWSHHLINSLEDLDPCIHFKLVYWIESYLGRCLLVSMFIKRMKLIPDPLIEAHVVVFL